MAKGIRSKTRRKAKILKKKRLQNWEAEKLAAVVAHLRASVESTSIDSGAILSLEKQVELIQQSGKPALVTVVDDAPVSESAPISDDATSKTSTSSSTRGVAKRPVTLKTRQSVRLAMNGPSSRKKQPTL